MWHKRTLVITAMLVASLGALAQANNTKAPSALTDQQAYCEYVTQQAAAQSDLLRTPSAVAGITQPNTGLPMQLVWGLSSSLSDMRKASLTMDAARKNCVLYTALKTKLWVTLNSEEERSRLNRSDRKGVVSEL